MTEGYSKDARLKRQEATIESLMAELDGLRETFNEAQSRADRNHSRNAELERELERAKKIEDAARTVFDIFKPDPERDKMPAKEYRMEVLAALAAALTPDNQEEAR